MGAILDQMYTTFVGALSLAFFGGVAFYIMYASQSRWYEFEELYARDETREPIARKLTGAVRLSHPGFRWGHLSGDLGSHRHPPVFVSVFEDGLRLSICPPFKYGCRDLFLPYAKMTIGRADWDTLSDQYALQMEGVDGFAILMFSNIVEWAAEHSEPLSRLVRRAQGVQAVPSA